MPVTFIDAARRDDLTARSLREVADKLYLARVFVGGRVRLAVVLDLLRQFLRRLVVFADDYVRLDDASPVLIGHGHDGALDDRGMFDEDTLDFEGPDTVAGREDNVIGTSHKPEVAISVPISPVAGQVVSVAEDRLGRIRLLPVLFEQCGYAPEEGDVTSLVGRALVAFVVDDPHVAAGRRFAHRARPYLEVRIIADEQGVLCLPVAVVDGQAVKLFPALDDRRVQRLSGGDGVADGDEVRAFEFRGLGEEAVLCRS